MDIESLGGGFGTGLIGTILGILGFKGRLNTLEKDKQNKSSCIPTHKAIDEKFIMMVDIQKEIREDQKCIRERVESISDYLRNNK